MNLDDPWNVTLERTWYRKHTDNAPYNNPSYWDFCKSDRYFTPYYGQTPIGQLHFQLPSSQEVRIFSNVACVAFTSGAESVVHRMNSADSWVDVKLEDRTGSGDPVVWNPWQFEKEWRVYGKSGVDIWDAPAHYQDDYSSWPPQDTSTHEYRTIVCEHYTSNDCGEAYQQNANDVDDIYRTSDVSLIEKAVTPVKGLWSGLAFNTDDHSQNEPACDVIAMEFTKLRIQRIDEYYRIWVGFGSGDPGWTGRTAESITYWDAWASADYSYVVDILSDGTLVEVDWGKNITWPTFVDETVIYDSELEIQQSGFLVLPVSPFDLMGPAGITEIFKITDEYKEDFKAYGFTDPYINWSYAAPLVKKPVVVEE